MHTRAHGWLGVLCVLPTPHPKSPSYVGNSQILTEMDSNDDQQATTNGGTETAPELPRTESYADAVIVSDVLDADPEAKGEDTTTDKSDVSGSEKLISGTEHNTQG